MWQKSGMLRVWARCKGAKKSPGINQQARGAEQMLCRREREGISKGENNAREWRVKIIQSTKRKKNNNPLLHESENKTASALPSTVFGRSTDFYGFDKRQQGNFWVFAIFVCLFTDGSAKRPFGTDWTEKGGDTFCIVVQDSIHLNI